MVTDIISNIKYVHFEGIKTLIQKAWISRSLTQSSWFRRAGETHTHTKTGLNTPFLSHHIHNTVSFKPRKPWGEEQTQFLGGARMSDSMKDCKLLIYISHKMSSMYLEPKGLSNIENSNCSLWTLEYTETKNAWLHKRHRLKRVSCHSHLPFHKGSGFCLIKQKSWFSWVHLIILIKICNHNILIVN